MRGITSKLRFLVILVCSALLAWPVNLAAQVATPAASPETSAAAHGVQLENMDLAADPRDDFLQYAAGGWQSRVEIPSDEGIYGVWDEVHDLSVEQLLGLLDRLAASDSLPIGSDEWKAVQLFAQAKDLATRNAQGITPIEKDLAAIDALSTREELYRYLRDGVLTTHIWGFYGIYAAPDLADSSIYTAWYSGPYLGLPSRDYYWVDDESNEAIRAAYRAMSAELLEYAGYDARAAEDAAQRIYDFEKRLAEPLLRSEDWNDPQNYYHPRPVAELAEANPDFDWPAFLEFLGIPEQETVVVTEEKYLAAVDEIVQATDLQTLKDYFKLQVLLFTADALTEEIGETSFAFYGTALDGIEEQRPIDERALYTVNGSVGFALGKLYVDEYFPPQAKAQMEELVAGVIEATRHRIKALTWMTPETREAALAKLDTLRVKVGYPETWRTYEGVTIKESLAETLLSSGIADYRWWLDRIGEPVDRDEWDMLPQEVNAYYNPTNNEIVFPAAILQPPFFDYEADPASNYGALGGVIGHEITHAFDQSGAQFDAEGNLTDWWTAEDHARFEELTAAVGDQYSAIELLPDLYVDGDLTIGENIADLGGIQIAYDALQIALEESGDPGVIDGLTQDQRFFIAWAFIWSAEVRDEYLRTDVMLSFHAPSTVRAVQPLRNMDAFAEAFAIEPGDPMYLPPEERIVIW